VENVLQLNNNNSEYNKTTEWYNLRREFLWYMNYVSFLKVVGFELRASPLEPLHQPCFVLGVFKIRFQE
jgi:hypothetical protein